MKTSDTVSYVVYHQTCGCECGNPITQVSTAKDGQVTVSFPVCDKCGAEWKFGFYPRKHYVMEVKL